MILLPAWQLPGQCHPGWLGAELHVKGWVDQDDAHEQVHHGRLQHGDQMHRDRGAHKFDFVFKGEQQSFHTSPRERDFLLSQGPARVVQEDIIQGGAGNTQRFNPVVFCGAGDQGPYPGFCIRQFQPDMVIIEPDYVPGHPYPQTGHRDR